MQASEKTARSRLDKVVAMLPESLAGERKRTGALVASAVQQAMGAAIGIIQGGVHVRHSEVSSYGGGCQNT